MNARATYVIVTLSRRYPLAQHRVPHLPLIHALLQSLNTDWLLGYRPEGDNLVTRAKWKTRTVISRAYTNELDKQCL